MRASRVPGNAVTRTPGGASTFAASTGAGIGSPIPGCGNGTATGRGDGTATAAGGPAAGPGTVPVGPPATTGSIASIPTFMALPDPAAKKARGRAVRGLRVRFPLT